jgi:DNA-binding LacI/PurR family transcriptional regulator
MASLRDVAQLAGVSLATASRVASGTAQVRPATRARVERAMRELLYVTPTRSSELNAIGLLVPELANPIFPALAETMENRATEHRLASILCNTGGSAANEIEYGQMLLARQVEGMIFISSEATDLRGEHGHYRRLVEAGAKIVFVNGAVPTIEIASVGVDERSAGELATQHLIELGHERIGFVAGPVYSRATIDKAAGRQMALSAAGIEDDGLVAHAEWGFEGGRAAMRKLLHLGATSRPTAVVCSSDVMAVGALRAARDEGVRVPEELSVVGFDGIQAGEWTEPPLTTLVQPIEELAHAAVDTLRLLFEENGRRVPHLVFRPRLLVRESTAPA